MNLQEHKGLLDTWRKLPRHATETFISDGPIDPNCWSTVGRRVLFLAKEAYGDLGHGKSPDLPKLVREEWKGPKYKFWWTLGYWAYGIQRLTKGSIPISPMVGELWGDVTEAILGSAVVNVKKSGGQSSSDNDYNYGSVCLAAFWLYSHVNQ